MSAPDSGEHHSALQGQSGWADIATALATRAFSSRVSTTSATTGDEEGDPMSVLVRWLRPSWSRRLRRIDDAFASVKPREQPVPELERLRRLHRAQAHVDLDRVHPTWWVRAIREESPAVQRLIAATAPESIRLAIQSDLLLDNADLASDRPAVPEVVEWVRSLWSERLVGDEPEHDDDSAAIMVLTRLSPRQGYRVCRLMGFIKLVISDQLADGPTHRVIRARMESIREQFDQRDLRIEVLTRRDVQSVDSSDVARQHRAARIGVLSLARLLADCELYRVRWALQHWPYPVAKLIRTLMAREARGSSGLLQWESRILKMAWDRLTFESTLPAVRSVPQDVRNGRS